MFRVHHESPRGIGIHPVKPRRGAAHVVTAMLVCGAATLAADVESVDRGKLEEAITSLVQETKENPANEAARVRLAEAYERADMADEAVTTWRQLLTLSRSEPNRRKARRALCRLRRRQLDRSDAASPSSGDQQKDPFKIDMPPVEWEGLEVVEDSKYLPPIPGHPYDVPPFVHETKHFTVYSTNERLSKVVGRRAEIYLSFMIDKLFGGRSWALRLPIVMYSSVSDYEQHGGPAGTGGVTKGHITGKTEVILLYQQRPDSLFKRGRRGRGGGGGGSGRQVWKYGIESVLPHELTHAVINEFFAGRPTPRWMHEAIAGRFEQTRDHYGEAARLARKVVAGEFFRMRDLFDQKRYPERISLFYEQAAAVVLYLFEAGPEAMHVFLTELAEGRGHDAACAAVLGIPEKNAVEEFERRWVEWMKARYVKDLDAKADHTEVDAAGKSEDSIFRPWVNEKDTVDAITQWRTIDLGSLEAFAGLADSKKDWSADGGKLRCAVAGEQASSLLGIRMDETAPVAVRCNVKCLAGPGSKNRWFGFTQLDADLNDTRVEVVAPLRDNNRHEIVCLWSDDLAVYLDGTCVGRYPAFYVAGNAPDIDYALALTAYGPVEISDLQVAPITRFSDKSVVAEAKGKEKQRGRKRADRRTRRGRRKRKGP